MTDNGHCDLYFLDSIYNKQSVNWFTGETTEESLLAEVIEKVNETKPSKVTVNIDSWGGSCDVGLGIYNYLRSQNIKRETKILNSCASIATVIAFSGDKGKITMPRNGIMVIHQAATTVSGNANDLQATIDILNVYTNNILDIYVQNNRKGKTKEELFALIKDGDYWMTGTQAKEMGFVDDTYNDESITVSNSLAVAKQIYNNIPANIQAIADAEETSLFKKIKNYFDMEVTKIIASFKKDLPNNGIVGSGENQIDFSALLETPITNMLTSIKEEIANEITNASNGVTETIQNGVGAIEEKYKGILDSINEKVENLVKDLNTTNETITNQLQTIKEQNETIEALSGDLEKLQGRQAPAAGKEDEAAGNTNNVKKTFKGRTSPVNIAD